MGDAAATDRNRLTVVAASLEAIETDEPAGAERLARAVADADAFRERHGLEPLRDDVDPPEEEFYRRARALGFRRISR